MLHYTSAAQTGQIESSLCGCCGDCSACCCALFCYPCASARVWADVRGESLTCCHCFHWPSNLWARENIRQARGMEPRFCCDCMTDFLCPCCFLIQNMREIEAIQSLKDIPSNTMGTNVSVYAQQGRPSC